MRFRLGTTGAGMGAGTQQMTDGIGRGLQSLFTMPLMQAQAAEEAQIGDAKRQALEAQIASNLATAGLRRTEQAQKDIELQQMQQRPDTLALMGSSRAGMSVPQFNAAISERTHGAPDIGPRLLPEPIEGLGPSGRTAAFDDAITTLYGPAMATPADKTNWEQLAKARGAYQTQALLGDVASGRADAARVGQAVAASEGKALINNIGNSGAGFNQFTGEGVTLNPGMYALFGDQGRADIARQQAAARASDASAGNSRAAADQHRAQIDKIRQEIEQGGGNAWQYDSARGVQVHKGSGVARDVTRGGAPLGPLKAPTADGKPLPTSAAKGYLENIQSLRQAEKALLLAEGKDIGDPAKGGSQGDAEATGWKGYLPNVLLNRMDPKGVETRAMIADLGSMVIHDRSGAAVTAAEFPRLAPFIPTVNDDAPTVQKKLRQFVTNYRAIVQDAEEFYRASGYHVPAVGGGAPQATKTGDGWEIERVE